MMHITAAHFILANILMDRLASQVWNQVSKMTPEEVKDKIKEQEALTEELMEKI